MKITKEYSLLLIIGLFILAYLLDAVVQPLDLVLQTPYQFLQGSFISTFPFSAASVLIKGLGLFLAPLWILSFFSDRGWGKASLLFIVSAIWQLYALQDVSTQSYLIPLEWSLSLSLAGAALLVPVVVLLLKNILFVAHSNLSNVRMEAAISELQRKSKQEQTDTIEHI